MGADAAQSSMKPPTFGNGAALSRHVVNNPRKKYVTPAPGDYAVEQKHNVRFQSSRASSFGNNLCKVDRVKTGVFGEMMDVALVNDGPVTLVVDSREDLAR